MSYGVAVTFLYYEPGSPSSKSISTIEVPSVFTPPEISLQPGDVKTDIFTTTTELTVPNFINGFGYTEAHMAELLLTNTTTGVTDV
jgi:hypothetical protein